MHVCKQISDAEWWALGRKLYGDNPLEWKFKCVRCGHVQSHASLLAHNPLIDPEHAKSLVYFSCEGRLTPGQGCDWTLGGLLQIHKLEVRFDDGDDGEDGEVMPVFEFADLSVEDMA